MIQFYDIKRYNVIHDCIIPSQEQTTPLSDTLLPVAANEATGRTPSTQDWPGDLGFDVRVEQSTRSKDPHYSAAMRKLFVNQKRTVNVLFTLNSAVPGLEVRAVAVYTSPDHYHLPVKVCYEHSYNSAQVLRKANAEHLVVSKNPDSVYLQDSGRDDFC